MLGGIGNGIMSISIEFNWTLSAVFQNWLDENFRFKSAVVGTHQSVLNYKTVENYKSAFIYASAGKSQTYCFWLLDWERTHGKTQLRLRSEALSSQCSPPKFD